MLEEIRMLKEAAREQDICRVKMRASLEIEIKVSDVGVAASGRGFLSDIEEDELLFISSCIAIKRARVNGLGLPISEVQPTVRNYAEIVMLHEERRAEKDALRAEVTRGLEACTNEGALRAEVFRGPTANRMSALNV